jgi:lipopolysaccharide assembly outer membrane protein LptD (OstA)
MSGPAHGQVSEAAPAVNVRDSTAAEIPSVSADTVATQIAPTDSLSGEVLSPAEIPRAPTEADRPPTDLPGIRRNGPRSAARGPQSPVKFGARDSLVIVIENDEAEKASLFGETKAEYKDARLEAERIDLMFQTNELDATGPGAGGGSEGRPVFNRGQETFTGDRMTYSLTTERGRVVGAQTSFEDGFIRAGVATITEDSTLYVKDGVYTTCSCVEDPSYSLRSSKMKSEDDKWIYTGPVQLFLFNIPTPLWLPFGIIPALEGRRSGPLPPQFGEDEFGFYIRDFGWYWALSDYYDLQVRLGLWSGASYELSTLFRYSKRYRFNGSGDINFARMRKGESGDLDYQVTTNGALRWNHSQTIDPTSSLSANVNLATAGYLRGVSQIYDDRVRQTVSSTIAYRKRWAGGRNLNINVNQRQAFDTRSANLTLPSLSFSQNTFKPFSRSSRAPGSGESWYEQITIRYGMRLNNTFDFVPLSDEQLLARGDTAATDIEWYNALFSPTDYRRATDDDQPFDFRANHELPISATYTVTQLPLLGRLRLNLSPNLNYTEDWVFRTVRKDVIDSTNAVVTRSEPGFLALRQFNTGISSNTTFYGIFPLRVGPYSGLRHTVRPTLGFTYRPDFSDPRFGYTKSYTDTTGRVVEYNIVNGVQSGEQKALTYGIANTFETKRVSSDTTSSARSRTVTLLNLDVRSGYNFARDSLKMADFAITARSKLFGKVDVNLRATYSPYALSSDGRRTVDDYYARIKGGFRLARLTQFSISARTSIRSQSRGSSRPVEDPRARFGSPIPVGTVPVDTGDPLLDGLDAAYGYSDFAIPWSLTMDFTYGLSKPGFQTTRRAIVNASTDFNLTPYWKIAARTGYDFERKELVTTSISIFRDLDCWQMSLNWIPFGSYQSFGFEIHVKSGHLADILRLSHPRNDVTGRFERMAGI